MAIDLNDPKLGKKLIKDAKGDLPLEVFRKYVFQHSEIWRPVLNWIIDPHTAFPWKHPAVVADKPEIAPLNPQEAVDKASPLAGEVIRLLACKPPHIEEAQTIAREVRELILRATSPYTKREVGGPAIARHFVVRGYIIRKFNALPKKPNDSTVGWDRIADLLFVSNNKCSRCQTATHKSNDHCVHALLTGYVRFKTAMKNDGVPL
jgi:hypothetical protein